MADNFNTKVKNILKNNNNDSVIANLKSLINKGNDESLNVVIGVYMATEDSELENQIFDFFLMISDKNFTNYAIKMLNNDFDNQRKAKIISFFWQSKLNFVDYLEEFVLLMNNISYEILIEAFTVIEEIINENELPENKLNNYIDTLKSYITGKEKNVKLLITQLINVISERL